MNKPTLQEELFALTKGYDMVVGLDEVGRGAFAGPVVTAGVVYSKEIDSKSSIHHANDSKLLTSSRREMLDKKMKQENIQFSLGIISVEIINQIGIGKATFMAFRQCVKNIQQLFPSKKIFVLVDGFYIDDIDGIKPISQKAIIKGDQKCISIAAASIIAKVYRDDLMTTLHDQYPSYLFNKNKGYGTKDHQLALKSFGLSPIHRTSFNLSKFL